MLVSISGFSKVPKRARTSRYVRFTGQLTERINTKMGKDHLMIYVRFKPRAMYRLLGIPMGVAHLCGYYDQMHLIRDFKEFTGVTPSKMDREMET